MSFDDIPPYEYTLYILDKRGREYCFSFRVYSNEVYVRGSWARDLVYVFPEIESLN